MKHSIEVILNNVSREEQEQLKEFLENNCWGWFETEREIDYDNLKYENKLLKEEIKSLKEKLNMVL